VKHKKACFTAEANAEDGFLYLPLRGRQMKKKVLFAFFAPAVNKILEA